MQRKSRSCLCYILTVIMLFTGMYFENAEVDSFFTCASVEPAVACISACDGTITNENVCTSEMLGVRNVSYVRQLAQRDLQGRREVKTNSDFLTEYHASQLIANLFTVAKTLQFSERYSKTVVLNYIHNTDGKKRI